MGYWQNLGTAVSQAVNTLIGGHPDESLSARAHHEQHNSRFWAGFRVISDMVFFWEPMHCARAARADVSYAGWVLRRSQGHRYD